MRRAKGEKYIYTKGIKVTDILLFNKTCLKTPPTSNGIPPKGIEPSPHKHSNIEIAIFQTMVWSKNPSLKYQRLKPSGCPKI